MAQELEITLTDGRVDIVDVQTPRVPNQLEWSAQRGSFQTRMSRDPNGVATRDTFQVIPPNGPIISFKASEVMVPVGPHTDFTTLLATLQGLFFFDPTISSIVMTSKTYAEWLSDQSSSLLPTGEHIMVSDRGDRGIILLCPTDSQIGLDGHGGFLNADHQAVGDYSSVLGYSAVAVGTNHGIWNVGLEATMLDGDIVIWDGFNFQLTDLASVSGINPNANDNAYLPLPRNVREITYSNLASGPFLVAQKITDSVTGWTGFVYSLPSAGVMRVYSPRQLRVTIDYSSLTGTFSANETVTASGGATGIIVLDNGSGQMVVNPISGNWEVSDTITGGTSGATATIDTATAPLEVQLGLNAISAGTTTADVDTIDSLYPVDGMGYIEEWDRVEFDFANDLVQRRTDRRGNDFMLSKSVIDEYSLTDGIPQFKWGADTCIGNSIQNGLMTVENFPGSFNGNSVAHGGIIQGIASDFTSSDMSNNSVGQQATMQNITLGDNAVVSENRLDTRSTAESLSLGTDTYFRGNTISAAMDFSGKTFSSPGAVAGCAFGIPVTETETISEEIGLGIASALGSTIETVFDCDSQSTLDYTGLAGTFQASEIVTADNGATATVISDNGTNQMTIARISGDWYGAVSIMGGTSGATATISAVSGQVLDIGAARAEYCGVIKVSGLETERMDTMANPPTAFKFTIRPEPGTAITFAGNTFGAASPGEFATPAGADITLTYPEIAIWDGTGDPIVFLDTNEGIV
jgi:hypothetical protein